MARVLVIGSGGREHTLAWKLKKSPHVSKVYCAPGNDGMIDVAEIIPKLDKNDFEGIADLVVQEDIDLTVVSPEDPLVNGIVDFFHRDGLVKKGYNIFGPELIAAQLEGSKVYAKGFMRRHKIPTAPFKVFRDPKKAKEYVKEKGTPIVIKASGLAAGKGSIVCKRSKRKAYQAIDDMMINKIFGDAGSQVVIEDFMKGEEASILALTDGTTIRTLVSSQDHKPAYNGDKGPNTGGMGAYAPAPVVTPQIMEKVYEDILIPIISGMAEEGTPFRGCLYAGLMIEDGEPRVVEYNVRFGDPETQPILSLLVNDLYKLLTACAEGHKSKRSRQFDLEKIPIVNKEGSSCCVVMASGGYPGNYTKGKVISGLEDIEKMNDVQVFHAGTKFDEEKGEYITNGGRVLGITGTGKSIGEAIARAYAGTALVEWDRVQYRTDIGQKALNR